MKIEFINHKKIITHPSGHVDEYDKEHLMKIKQDCVRRYKRITDQIKLIEVDISKL